MLKDIKQYFLRQILISGIMYMVTHIPSPIMMIVIRIINISN